jgi:hypothetical protein
LSLDLCKHQLPRWEPNEGLSTMALSLPERQSLLDEAQRLVHRLHFSSFTLSTSLS